jgi:hypothetical protein
VTVRDVKRNPRTAYLQSTRAPILILFFYFSYYLTVVATTYLSEYGASIDPRLWMNASAMGCMVGVALNSCAISPGQSVGTYLGEAPLRCLRFFIIPFCVSSISSLVMGCVHFGPTSPHLPCRFSAGSERRLVRRVNYAATARGVPPVFFLVFPTGTHQLATCFGVPTLVALSLVIVRRLLALPGERSGYIVDSVSDPDDDPDTEESIYLPQVLLHRSPENPLQQEPGDLDSMEKGPPPAAPSRRCVPTALRSIPAFSLLGCPVAPPPALSAFACNPGLLVVQVPPSLVSNCHAPPATTSAEAIDETLCNRFRVWSRVGTVHY